MDFKHYNIILLCAPLTYLYLEQGHSLSFLQIDDAEIALKEYGEYLFDSIIFFATSSDGLNSITLGDIVDFVNDGGNLLFATSYGVNDGLRLFAGSLGVEFDPSKTSVIDHFAPEPAMDEK